MELLSTATAQRNKTPREHAELHCTVFRLLRTLVCAARNANNMGSWPPKRHAYVNAKFVLLLSGLTVVKMFALLISTCRELGTWHHYCRRAAKQKQLLANRLTL